MRAARGSYAKGVGNAPSEFVQFWAGCDAPDPASTRYIRRLAPIAQLAEAADLKSVQCRFESDWGHRICTGRCAFRFTGNLFGPVPVSHAVTSGA